VKTMNDKKRKLSLLPEVLPAPQPIAGGGPRQRTIKNLRRLAAAASAVATIQGCNGGYQTVDPVPPPARCSGLADSIEATVAWTASGTIVLKLGKPTFTGSSYTNTVPPVSGGILVKADIQADSASIEIRPSQGEVEVIIDANCPSGAQQLLATFSVSMIPDGGTLPVSLIDQRTW
jgi:hypothetical protein